MNRLLRAIRSEILIADGALGSMLYAKGIGTDTNFEHLNLVRPSLVGEIHDAYRRAGARMLETNTFGANRIKLGLIGLQHKVREINIQGARLARSSAGGGCFVAGSIGPLPRVKGAEKEPTPEEVAGIFLEQASALAEGGVDLLILETFADPLQLALAVEAVKGLGLPVIGSLAVVEGGRLANGWNIEDGARAAVAAGADIVGVNCGAGPLEAVKNVRRLAAAVDVPIACFPNNGFPEYVDGRYIYRSTPDYFAAMGEEARRAGAVILGGCCGTTPDHIAALTELLSGVAPAARGKAVAPPVTAGEAPARPDAGFWSDWGKRKIVTVEIDPPKGLDWEKCLEGARLLKEAGADAVNIAENPLARVRLGNIALAHLIEKEVGIPVIVHVTCRDRNLLGLQSDLMGASLLGIGNILAVTGDPARLGDQAGATSVYDLNSFQLIALLRSLNTGFNLNGEAIGRGAGFVIGAAFNPNTPKPEIQVGRLEKKIANGATFAQTQPVYDPEAILRMLAMTERLDIPVLPGILPLVSGRNCEFLHNEVPGITIPDSVRERMRGKEKDEGRREGVAIAKELIDATFDAAGGYYLVTPFARYEVTAELVRHIRARP